MLSSMLFFPEKNFYEKPGDYGFASEDVSIEASGAKLHAWYLKAPEEKGVLLFFHGNAGNISHRLYKAPGWVKRGFSVLLVDYRGYGQSTGKISSQDDVLRDAEAAWDYLVKKKGKDPACIVLYGESLGTYAAISLGSTRKALAVVLEAPFTSFVDLARLHYPMVPEALMQDFAFSNAEKIGKLQNPLFILHGTEDEICPYSMAEKLFAAAPGPKEFFTVRNGRHNDLPAAAGEDFYEKPFRFLSGIKG